MMQPKRHETSKNTMDLRIYLSSCRGSIQMNIPLVADLKDENVELRKRPPVPSAPSAKQYRICQQF
jgi:hypothetical protein